MPENEPAALPSLITPDARAGLVLAGKLADQLNAEVLELNAHSPRPGGMNYLMSPPISREATVGILFYAIAAANHGWPPHAGMTN